MGIIINPRQIIKDGITSLRDVWSSSKVSAELSGKQATLVSGTNIKTVNTHSLLGSGDIHISGGGDIPKINMTATTATLDPNKFYVWGEVASLDISLAAETAGIQNVYKFQFQSGVTPTTLILPIDVEWDGGVVPAIIGMEIYIISIVSNIAKIERQRSIIGADNYIANGLIFYLDGINKGATNGDWVDLINGRVYTPTSGAPSAKSNHFSFTANGTWLECLNDAIDTAYYLDCTLEVCLDCNLSMPKICFGNKAVSNTMFFTVDGGGYNYGMCITPNMGFAGAFSTRTYGTVQCDRSTILLNGVAQTDNHAKPALDGNYVGLHRVQPGGWLRIYSIRIYNRKLEAYELDHNRQADNIRFNLGL